MLRHSNIRVNYYPDGSSYFNLKKSDIVVPNFIFDIDTYHDLWLLNQFVDACNSLDIVPDITIPRLIDAQADRRFYEGSTYGAKLVLQFLNQMNATFRIYHPHNSEIVEAIFNMNKCEILTPYEFLSDVLSNYEPSDTVVLSPDAGAYKWVNKTLEELGWDGEVTSASKCRGAHGTATVLPTDDFNGKKVLIVDDLCIRGGTFKNLERLIRDRNASSVDLAVSHITIDLTKIDNPITSTMDKVYTTDSNKSVKYWDIYNLKVIELFNI